MKIEVSELHIAIIYMLISVSEISIFCAHIWKMLHIKLLLFNLLHISLSFSSARDFYSTFNAIVVYISNAISLFCLMLFLKPYFTLDRNDLNAWRAKKLSNRCDCELFKLQKKHSIKKQFIRLQIARNFWCVIRTIATCISTWFIRIFQMQRRAVFKMYGNIGWMREQFFFWNFIFMYRCKFPFFSSHVMWNYSHFFTTFKCYFLVELNIQQQQKYSQLWSQPQRFWFVTNTHHSVSITMINGALEIDNFSPFSSWLTHFSSLYKTKKEIYSTLTVD